MKILHLDNNHPTLIDQLTKAGHDNKTNYTITKQETEQIIAPYDGIVIRSRFTIDKNFIDAAKNLKFIARVGAGLESIDIPYAQSKGIHLISAPEGNRNAVAEHALGMLLSLFNQLNTAHKSVTSGQWQRETHRGIELDGRTVGIIGYGNMGKAFAKKLRGFDCKVICYDILQNVGDANASQVTLAHLQQEADVLSLHTPWTPQTNQMINSDFINAFQKPFYFINTARGKSVVTADLVKGLNNGNILGAGLDVLEYEKSSFESLFDTQNNMPEALKSLITMNNVILSPHIAGWTHESKRRLAQTIVDKILLKF